jgi:hypothetical protein
MAPNAAPEERQKTVPMPGIVSRNPSSVDSDS